MDRLMSSSASSSSSLPQILPKQLSPLLTRFGRTYSPKRGFPPSKQPELKQINLICCKNENPTPSSSISSQSLNKLPSLLRSSVESSKEIFSPSRFPKQIDVSNSGQQKALPVGTLVLLSALIVSLIHPLFPSPAFATLQSAAKAGGSSVRKGLLQTELLSSAWTGFFAGCLHTLSGPDHLAALAPLSIGRTRMESAAVGALWGCGHDAGQVIFGLIFLLLKDRLRIEIIRTWGTRVVGLTLLVIGALGIKEASEVPTPTQCVALEDGERDSSIYEILKSPTIKKKKIGFATFATGIIHGLQPDALMMVLPALALPSRMAGAAFLVMFLVGTVVAMGCYTVFIGSCSEALKQKVPRITEKLTWASSIVAITLGSAIIISQLFGYSLY